MMLMKRIYGKPMAAGWILASLGIAAIFAGFKLAKTTGADGFFALVMLGGLFVISGITILGVYAAMEAGVSRALKDSAPLFEFTLTARDYSLHWDTQVEEIRSANKMSLIIALIFCGLLAIGGPFFVKENPSLFSFISIGLAFFLVSACWLATKYRVNKLKNSDKKVVLTAGGAYIGGQFHAWKTPASFLNEAVYFEAGQYEKNPLPLIRITYSAMTGTIMTPYTVLIPVPPGVEEKAKDAVRVLQGGVKLAEHTQK